MKHTYLIEAEKRDALEALVNGAIGFIGEVGVEYEAMVRVSTEDDHLADMLDLVLQTRDLGLGRNGAGGTADAGWVREGEAKPESNGHHPGVCQGCGGPTETARTKWCSKPECKKKQKENWVHRDKAVPANEEQSREEPALEAPAPFGQQILPARRL